MSSQRLDRGWVGYKYLDRASKQEPYPLLESLFLSYLLSCIFAQTPRTTNSHNVWYRNPRGLWAFPRSSFERRCLWQVSERFCFQVTPEITTFSRCVLERIPCSISLLTPPNVVHSPDFSVPSQWEDALQLSNWPMAMSGLSHRPLWAWKQKKLLTKWERSSGWQRHSISRTPKLLTSESHRYILAADLDHHFFLSAYNLSAVIFCTDFRFSCAATTSWMAQRIPWRKDDRGGRSVRKETSRELEVLRLVWSWWGRN